MAFGKAITTTKCLDPVKEDILLKSYQDKEQERTRGWKYNWGWILDEYQEYRKESQKISENSEFLAHVKEGQITRIDDRSIKPVPESVNHVYGWLAERKEFTLHTYGDEYFHPLPLPQQYKLLTEPGSI